MLNILEGFDDLADLGHNSAAYLHRLIEAKKLAFADRDAHLGTRAHAGPGGDADLEGLRGGAAGADLPGSGGAGDSAGHDDDGDTIYLTVVDKDRNALSLIYSIFGSFGSGAHRPRDRDRAAEPGTGFSLEEGHPNELAPGKLALHTNMPGMAFRDGRPWITYGVMGGDMQPQGHTQVLLNLIDFGMHVQKAGEVARFRHGALGVGIESGVDADVRAALTRMGHTVMTRSGPTAATRRSGSTGSRACFSADPMSARTARQWATEARRRVLRGPRRAETRAGPAAGRRVSGEGETPFPAAKITAEGGSRESGTAPRVSAYFVMKSRTPPRPGAPRVFSSWRRPLSRSPRANPTPPSRKRAKSRAIPRRPPRKSAPAPCGSPRRWWSRPPGRMRRC